MLDPVISICRIAQHPARKPELGDQRQSPDPFGGPMDPLQNPDPAAQFRIEQEQKPQAQRTAQKPADVGSYPAVAQSEKASEYPSRSRARR